MKLCTKNFNSLKDLPGFWLPMNIIIIWYTFKKRAFLWLDSLFDYTIGILEYWKFLIETIPNDFISFIDNTILFITVASGSLRHILRYLFGTNSLRLSTVCVLLKWQVFVFLSLTRSSNKVILKSPYPQKWTSFNNFCPYLTSINNHNDYLSSSI